MGRLKKCIALVYLFASLAVMGSFAASLFGPYTLRFAELLSNRAYRAFMLACMAVCFMQLLYVLGRVLFDCREPDCIHPGGVEEIEVTTSALEAVARTAASDGDVLIEEVRCRVTGREASSLKVDIDAIALVEVGLDALARRIQDRVAISLDSMLGATSASVRVRFLPSKTTTVTKEVSGDQF